MFAILRQAVGVVLGGMIVAAITLAPRVYANDEITVTSLQAPVTVAETNQTDKRMTYQGMLLKTNGQPVSNGNYRMTFRIYNIQTGGAPLWEYTYATVPVNNGLFTVLLPVGKDGNAETHIFTGQSLYLGVTVEGDQEALPRQPLLYVPYAYWARNADELSGKGAKWLPLAYGVIDRETGGVVKGSGNFTSKFRDDDGRYYYEIRIDNEFYYLNDYVTIVTPISQKECPDPTVAHTNSIDDDGALIVDLKDGNGNLTKCKFHFVTFKL